MNCFFLRNNHPGCPIGHLIIPTTYSIYKLDEIHTSYPIISLNRFWRKVVSSFVADPTSLNGKKSVLRTKQETIAFWKAK